MSYFKKKCGRIEVEGKVCHAASGTRITIRKDRRNSTFTDELHMRVEDLVDMLPLLIRMSKCLDAENYRGNP